MSILTTADRFRRELEALLNERIQAYMTQAAAGIPLDYSEYSRLVGRIAGLREALDEIGEAAHRLYYEEGEGRK